MDIHENKIQKRIFFLIKIILVCYIIYFTIVWNKVFIDLLLSNLSAETRGFKMADNFSDFTTKNLFIYLLIKSAFVISTLLLLVWRSKWAGLLFFICITPLITDYGYLFIKLLKQDVPLNYFFKELIYVIFSILILILLIIPKSRLKSQTNLSYKEIGLFIFLLIISFFVYNKYNLKF